MLIVFFICEINTILSFHNHVQNTILSIGYEAKSCYCIICRAGI